MSDAAARAERAMVVALLAIATLGFGAVSLCGGYWTAIALPAMFRPSDGDAVKILGISLPSLIGGFLLARRCARSLARREHPEHANDPHEPGA